MKSFSLKWKVAIAATLLMVVVLLLVGAVQAYFLHKDLTRLLSDQQFALVTRVAEDLDSKIATSVDLLARSAKGLPPEILASPAAVREYYRARPGVFASFDDVFLIAPDGRMIADYPELPARANSNAADRQYFQQVMTTGKPVVAKPVIGKARGEPVVQLGAPIFGRDGRIAGVLGGVIRLYEKNFLAQIVGAKVGQTGYYFILSKDSESVFVAHPKKELILQPRPSGRNDAVTRALAGFEGSAIAVNTSGLEAIFSFKSLKSVNWLLVAVLPTQEAFAPVKAAEERLWGILAVAATVLMPLLWALTWLLLDPLAALRKKIEGMRNPGAVIHPVLAKRNDEIGVLAHSFNELMRSLHETGQRHQQSEERLRTIADNLPAMIGYVDTDERYQFVNQTWADWYGRVRESCIGSTVREIVGESAYAQIGPRLKQALAGTPVTYQRDMIEVSVPRKLEASYLPALGPDGVVRGCYVMIQDISAIKDAEARQRVFSAELEQRVRQRTAELEASNRELQTFAYSVAHDFRTPLRAMDGYSALLLQEHAAQLDAEGRSYLGRMRVASARLATLIDDLLRLAQLTQRELKHEAVDLGAAAEAAVNTLRSGEVGRSVEVRVEKGMMVRGDRALLAALLKELIGNAWKFSGRRANAKIDVGSRAHEGGRAYFVRDNGTGFDMAYADKLFTPFQRLHGIGEFPGSGVGLALASRIVERHGGRIWPEATPGEGATFVFTLPDLSLPQPGSEAPEHLRAA